MYNGVNHMAVKRSVSGYCPHLKKKYIIAVWFREVKHTLGERAFEKMDFECNTGYRTGCNLIKSCPVYNDAAYTDN